MSAWAGRGERFTPAASGLLVTVLVTAAASGQSRPPEVTWTERLEVATGDAYQGRWQENESRFRYVDDPTVCVDSAGAVAVAWVDQLRKDILLQVFSREGRERFGRPTNVSRSARVFSWLPRVATAPDDPSRVYVLWQEIVFSGGSHGGEIFFARSTDGGRSFERPRNLSKSSAGDGKGRLTKRSWHNGSLDLALGRDGPLYAAWTEYEGGLWLSRSTDGGRRFSKPVRVAEAEALPARGPSLAVTDAGTLHVAWAVGEDPGADIHLARSDDGGRSFTPPRAVGPAPGHADAPRLVADREGTLHLAYAESPGGPSGRYRVLYTRSGDGGRSFADPREISSPLPRGFASAAFPSLGVDGRGRLSVVWELFPAPAGRPRGLGFTVSDGTGAFAPPVLVPGSADPALGHGGGRQGLLMSKLALDPDGDLAVVHSTFREGEASHVWLFRGRVAR